MSTKFIKNKYFECYYRIIKQAQNQDRSKSSGDFETHHIVPKSLGGSNEKENLVLLTIREHFICHHLLTKFTQGNDKYKMMYALSFFTSRSLTSRQHSIACRINSISKTGTNNPMHGATPWNKGKSGYLSDEAKLRIRQGQQRWRDAGGMTDEYKQKISNSLKGRAKPPGFGDKLSESIKGENHWSFKGYYHTPVGRLSSSTQIENTIPNQLVRKWCKNPDKKITKHSFSQSKFLQSLGPDIIGKSFRDIGFYFEPKD